MGVNPKPNIHRVFLVKPYKYHTFPFLFYRQPRFPSPTHPPFPQRRTSIIFSLSVPHASPFHPPPRAPLPSPPPLPHTCYQLTIMSQLVSPLNNHSPSFTVSSSAPTSISTAESPTNFTKTSGPRFQKFSIFGENDESVDPTARNKQPPATRTRPKGIDGVTSSGVEPAAMDLRSRGNEHLKPYLLKELELDRELCVPKDKRSGEIK